MSKGSNLLNEAIKYVRNGHKPVREAAVHFYNADILGVTVDTFRKQIGKALKDNIKPEPEAKPKSEPKPFVLSAWNFDTGRMMGIEEYCAFYGLPYNSVLSYKLVTHTGTPFYNTLFRDTTLEHEVVSLSFIEQILIKHAGYQVPAFELSTMLCGWFDRAVYTDCHVGMCTDKDGIAMYATPWNKEEQMRRAAVMVAEILSNRVGTVLYLDELGDFMDGYNGYTTRGGHKLPQNMSNEEAFDVGMDFKMYLIDTLAHYYDKIYLNNICNDNHAGSFGYVVNSAVQKLCAYKYPDKVVINNQRQFINHYIVGKHAFVNTHGKDAKSLKFGFKPKLDAVQIEKIDAYLKRNDLYRKADYIEFAKGDSHQMLFDWCTSDDFVYFNYPAFSPSSEWVQNNFKKGRSGFVIQNVMYDQNVKNIIPKFF